MSNYQQPDYRVPVSPGVTVQVENILNLLVIVAPLPKYNQPLDHPAAPVSNQLSDAMCGDVAPVAVPARYEQPADPPGRESDPRKAHWRNPLGM